MDQPLKFQTWSGCLSSWWFQIFFIFTLTWGNDPIWLIFFRWVETTNQLKFQGESSGGVFLFRPGWICCWALTNFHGPFFWSIFHVTIKSPFCMGHKWQWSKTRVCEVLQQQAYLLFYTRISAGQEVRPWKNDEVGTWKKKITQDNRTTSIPSFFCFTVLIFRVELLLNKQKDAQKWRLIWMLKGWIHSLLKDEFSFGDGPFSGAFAMSFREAKHWLFDLGKYFGQPWNNQNQCVKW